MTVDCICVYIFAQWKVAIHVEECVQTIGTKIHHAVNFIMWEKIPCKARLQLCNIMYNIKKNWGYSNCTSANENLCFRGLCNILYNK